MLGNNLIRTAIEEWKRPTHEFPKRGKSNIGNHINRFGYRRKETSHEWLFCSWKREKPEKWFPRRKIQANLFASCVPHGCRRTKGHFFSICCFDILIGAVSICSMTQPIPYFDVNWGLMIEFRKHCTKARVPFCR